MTNEANILRHQSLIQLADIYKKVIDTWSAQKEKITSEPNACGVPHLTKQEFNQALVGLDIFLRADETNLIFNPIAASTYLRNGHFANMCSNLINQINALHSSPAHWPQTIDSYFNFINALSFSFFVGPNLSSGQNHLKDLAAKAVQINEYFRKTESLQGFSEATRKDIEAAKSTIEARRIEVDKLHVTISNELKSLEDYKQGLNQKGLAGAFSSQAINLNGPLRGWLITFVVSILIICSVSLIPFIVSNIKLIFLKGPSLEQTPETIRESLTAMNETSTYSTKTHLSEMLIKILMSAPMIWLAWFAAKRYSFTRKLQEEYEFKSAIATAFYGYSKEASTNEALKIQLLEGAIRNFNENPSQTIENHKHHISPLEEAVVEAVRRADLSLVSNFKSPGK